MFRDKSNNRCLVKTSMLITVISVTLVACNTVPVDTAGRPSTGSSSSLVDYLYPSGERPPGLAVDIPQLTVPVRIGIAFVPGTNNSWVITQNVKNNLLRKVKQAFKYHTVVQEIRIIPTDGLSRKGGFRELRHVAQRYNVDLVALVSHNQIRAIRNNSLSITYLTIVGVLIIPGNSHQVSTFVDTAVFDVASAKLLFRAAGKDRVRRQTSVFALIEKNRLISLDSMNKATGDMILSLNTELRKFRTRIRQGSNEADIRYRRGYKGNRYRGRRYRSSEQYSGQRLGQDEDYNNDYSRSAPY